MNAPELISTVTPPPGAELVGTGIWPEPGLAIARRADRQFIVSTDGLNWSALAIVVDCDDSTVTARCPHAPAGEQHAHIHTRSNGAHEDLGIRVGHDGCPDYSVGDVHGLQRRYDAGHRWEPSRIRIGRPATPRAPRATRGYSTAGRHHGYRLAKHRRSGRLIGLTDGRWLPVARIVRVTPHQLTIECGRGCKLDGERRTHRLYIGRIDQCGEGERSPLCAGSECKGAATGQLILDLDDLCQDVPLCPCRRDRQAACRP